MAAKRWAQFKGNRFPAVAVRDLAIQPRDNDLVLATHGRGIWIIDDITPLRALTPDCWRRKRAFVAARPVQQRIQANGGWAKGDAIFIGDNPPDARRHHLLSAVASSLRQTENRSARSIRARSSTHSRRANARAQSRDLEHARKAAAGSAGRADRVRGTRGPRVSAGHLYGAHDEERKVDETKITVGLDRRAKFTEADRKAQYDAAMKVRALFGDESALMDRILSLRGALAKRPPVYPE